MVKPEKGMTLIELIVVMVLIATITGLATIRFVQSHNDRSLDHFVKELTSYLRYVQFKAIEEGVTHKLEVDSETGALVSLRKSGRWDDYEKFRTPFSNRFEKAEHFNLDWEDGRGVYFFPDGNVTKNRLTVSKDLDQLATIRIKNRIGVFQVKYNA